MDLTAAEVFEISQGAASLPGRWSAVSQCTNDGTTYAGLIDPAGNGQVAVLIARDSGPVRSANWRASSGARLRQCDGRAGRRPMAATPSVERLEKKPCQQHGPAGQFLSL